YHLSLGQVMQAYVSRQSWAQQNLNKGLQQLQEAVSGLDQSRDRDTLLQDHYNTFSMPLRFPYQPHEEDQAGKSMLTAKSSLLEGIGDNDLESSVGFGLSQVGSNENLTVKPSVARRRANLLEVENVYFT
ncbi:hypothetical protein GOODEAATRI_029090, partial [Goodea atripinnis]